MKKVLLTKLRNFETSKQEFRAITEQISLLLAAEAGAFLPKQSFPFKTPVAETTGERLTQDIVIIPILRAGLAMLPAFLKFYPEASVGFFGMRRDETTKKPNLYYENLPDLDQNKSVIIIDPMIATGGSGILALEKVKEKGIKEENIIYVGIIGSPEGVKNLKAYTPKAHLCVATIDERLNDEAFIIPGIGDFGDRFFGTC